mgnify:CR=1 FL=1
MADRNFDDLATKFARKIYGGSKGAIRMAVLERDLRDAGLFENPPARMLEAGGGFGLFGQRFAPLGTDTTVVDISQAMLAEGQAMWREKQTVATDKWGTITWQHQAIQDTQGAYPLVCCHAVLEWVEEPEVVLSQVVERVDESGTLSLMVFNEVALVWKNVLFGRIEKVLSERLHGFGNSLTPKHAFTIAQIEAWLTERGMVVERISGVRIFHDFLNPTVRERLWQSADTYLHLELQYSTQPVYRDMARYLHFVCRKSKA